MTECDTTSHHQLFDIPKTEREAKLQPNYVRDSFGRVAMTRVGWYSRLHAESIAYIPAMSEAV
jgi:hypothetical protein